MSSSTGVSINYAHPIRPEDELVNGQRPLCYCGIPSKLRTSAKSNSIGRRFFNCRYYKGENQCGFFQWVDLARSLPVCCQRTLELADQRNERMKAERARIEAAKLQSMKRKYNIALITSLVLLLALLCTVKFEKLNDNVNHLMLPK
ncbi:hypothetical protein F2P56_022797 [Juglans regia]|uniref:Uncharacterized protein LOC108990073 n=2 Tax=Juglans regia TaxID=51240 RepID=A0A2I4EJA0_JUGRE|nr:uncharacterized protein LOC108990073 [Juglans regia]KAF5458792.1 hypothetical protein F2P56_022797 [Juglans regia]